jgi:hypothetical protein
MASSPRSIAIGAYRNASHQIAKNRRNMQALEEGNNYSGNSKKEQNIEDDTKHIRRRMGRGFHFDLL